MVIFISILLDEKISEPKHLPCLQVNNTTHFFMTDAAVKYLMSDIEEDTDLRSQVMILMSYSKKSNSNTF